MTKRRRKSDKRRAQSAAALKQNGLRAFKRGDYSQAIETWERVGRHPLDVRLRTALAEAYFRRGLSHLYGKSPNPPAGLRDLTQATELQPDDPRYRYHLGLAMHHRGDLDEAMGAYRTVRQSHSESEFAARAAYPLALALLQTGKDPANDPMWSELSAEEQSTLDQAATFHRRPYTLSPDAPPLWRSMAALDAGDREQARVLLDSVIESATDPVEQGMAHYYRGVLAAQEESWDEARRQWGAAHAAGLAIPRLTANLGEAYHRLAEERLADASSPTDVEDVIAAAIEALRHTPDDKRLNELFSQAHQRLAYQAASAGRWSAALAHWEEAHDAEGGSFRLAYNLALAHERCEDFFSAGELWREALRRRPRRDDHPDAITDEQVAQLWRRSAEAYTKDGEYDEAVHVYRQAVKWNPDNLETRLALVEALLTNGQIQAAENELGRILERDPDNVSALLRQGEVIAASGRWWRWDAPTSYWERVLELEPDNATARQLLADFYQDEAEARLSWGDHVYAVHMYRQALEYQPRNGRILAALGGCHLRMGEESTARSYFENALTNNPDALDVYSEIIHAWFDVDDPDKAWDTLERAEAAIENLPYEFYLAQVSYCITDYEDEIVRPWLERAVEKAPADAPVLAAIGEMAVMTGALEIGREYLERAIEADQEPGQMNLMLGILSSKEGDNQAAERYWKEAERIAHRDRDRNLQQRVETARVVFTAPPGLADLMMRLGRGPFGAGPFLDFPDDEYDDDDDDDDDDFFFDV